VSDEATDEEKGGVDVLLAPWPNPPRTICPLNMRGGIADPEGKFTIRRVRPGHYKVVAARSGNAALDVNVAVDVAVGSSNVKSDKLEQ
jgi:hypothetical protein